MNQINRDKIKDICTKFMECWEDRNYKNMHSLLQKTWAHKQDDITENIKNILENNPIDKYKIYDIQYNNRANDVLKMDIFADAKVEVNNKLIHIRIVKEKDPYKPSEDGEWGINPISILKEL